MIYRLLVGVVALAAISLLVVAFAWTRLEPVPLLTIPNAVDLGSQEPGLPAVGSLQIRNDGKAELIVSNISTSCSCAGLEIVQLDGSYRTPKTICIPPGNAVEAVIRIAVNGRVGESLGTLIEFATNDPGRQQVVLPVKFTISGGLRAVPETLALGTVTVDQSVQRVVEIWDQAVPPRRIDRIELSRPDQMSAVILPSPESDADSFGRHSLGRIQVTVDSSAPRDVDCKLSVWLADSARTQPLVIPVIGRVEAEVRFAPDTLILPLQTGRGPVYTGTVLCLHRGEPFRLRVADCTPGFRADLVELSAPGISGQLSIEREPGVKADRAAITVRATRGDREFTLPLTVLVRP